MPNAIWISRHAATQAQVLEIYHYANNIVAADAGLELGGRSINSDEDLAKYMRDLRALIKEHRIEAVFGVIPTPVLGRLFRAASVSIMNGDWTAPVPVYAAWNIQRSPEGGKPTFEHHSFVCVGCLETYYAEPSEGMA